MNPPVEPITDPTLLDIQMQILDQAQKAVGLCGICVVLLILALFMTVLKPSEEDSIYDA